MSAKISFILNDREVTSNVAPGTLVLDYLRRETRLVGTKEGCKEGDCGACMVLVGELVKQRVAYKPVTSCLMAVGELHGKHLVTIEGLNMAALTPVQRAIVDEGGSQCGFCTPGFVVSLTGYLMHAGSRLDSDGMKYAMGGNLCRCTGYASLKRAGETLIHQFGSGAASGNGPTAQDSVARLIEAGALPEYFETIPARLKRIPQTKPVDGKDTPDYFVAGGTDIYVQRGESLPGANVQLLNLRPELKGISVEKGKVHVGALTTFEVFAHHPEILKIIPDMLEYNLYNASWQIRNRATIGGNIVNASPIGDMTALLLAMESELVLQTGNNRRIVPMTAFFKGYKTLDKRPDEVLSEVIFPVPAKGVRIHFEKVAKRKTLDIASVNSAIRVASEEGLITDVALTMGGVAPVPLFMQKTCACLAGQPVSRDSILTAISVAQGEVAPISDIRGSADYKRLLVRQLIIAHFTRLFPEHVTVREFYEAH